MSSPRLIVTLLLRAERLEAGTRGAWVDAESTSVVDPAVLAPRELVGRDLLPGFAFTGILLAQSLIRSSGESPLDELLRVK